MAFELEAFQRADAFLLGGSPRQGVRIIEIGNFNIEIVQRDQSGERRRLILDADFVLTRFLRLQRVARRRVCTNDSLEGFRIARIRRKAIVEPVEHTDAG